jgi:hypothetical protein
MAATQRRQVFLGSHNSPLGHDMPFLRQNRDDKTFSTFPHRSSQQQGPKSFLNQNHFSFCLIALACEKLAVHTVCHRAIDHRRTHPHGILPTKNPHISSSLSERTGLVLLCTFVKSE